jgi:methyl-accepting chemotaxis protein/hemerythrin
MPDLISWNDIYSVQIQRFDAQHKVLFKIINRLNDAADAATSPRAIAGALNELVEYLRTHFADEEGAMVKYGYPGYDRHLSEHQQFTKQVQDFRQKFAAGKVAVSNELMQFLQTWLKQHILRTDRAYSSFLVGKGIR